MIYLIAARAHGLCKIGFGTDPQRRMATLQTACPFDLELVAVRDGARALERRIHTAAQDHRVRGEWFSFIPEVVKAFNETDLLTRHGAARTHAEIIRAAGIEQIVELVGAPIHTVRSWSVRDSIPAKHWALLVEQGVATADELMAGAAAA